MRLLLDTHIWLWSFLDPDKLGVRVERELKDIDNELWLSPISTLGGTYATAKAQNRTHWRSERLVREDYE